MGYMQAHARRLYSWAGSLVYTSHAHIALGCLFYIEAIIFCPAEPILILYCLERRENSYWYASIATIASVFGGITSYCLGYFLWSTMGNQIIHNSLLNYLISPQTFTYACQQFKAHEAWSLLALGFTPIPFKAATLSAGFCKLSLIPFLIATLIARGARFFGCAYVVKRWGQQVKEYIDRYLTILVVCMIIVIALAYFFMRS